MKRSPERASLDKMNDGTYAINMMPIVIDTNVFVSALRSKDVAGGAARALLRAALTGKCVPLFGNALWLEYEDLLGRSVWTENTTHAERLTMLQALADEGDNHLIELAIAGNARAIVTYNMKDLQRGQLLWPQLRILTPQECLKEIL